jgi:hypothetical protein
MKLNRMIIRKLIDRHIDLDYSLNYVVIKKNDDYPPKVYFSSDTLESAIRAWNTGASFSPEFCLLLNKSKNKIMFLSANDRNDYMKSEFIS